MPGPKNIIFCPNCQVEVEAVKSLGPGGRVVPRCSICGTIVEESDVGEVSSVSLDEDSFIDDSISIPALEKILVVGYTPGVRQILIDKMIEKHLAREVAPCVNGEEMIIKIIQKLGGGNGGSIDLVVTDVPMPFLNGINAAIGLRALERTYPNHDLLPILFLTNKPCDDTFKKVIKYLAPAKYATLGPIDDQPGLIKHLNRIIGLLAQEKW